MYATRMTFAEGVAHKRSTFSISTRASPMRSTCQTHANNRIERKGPRFIALHKLFDDIN